MEGKQHSTHIHQHDLHTFTISLTTLPLALALSVCTAHQWKSVIPRDTGKDDRLLSSLNYTGVAASYTHHRRCSLLFNKNSSRSSCQIYFYFTLKSVSWSNLKLLFFLIQRAITQKQNDQLRNLPLTNSEWLSFSSISSFHCLSFHTFLLNQLTLLSQFVQHLCRPLYEALISHILAFLVLMFTFFCLLFI